MKSLSINVHASEPLSKAVQLLLFSKGVKWASGDQTVFEYAHSDPTYLQLNSKMNEITVGGIADYTEIDAATEFGRLVELLEAPPEVKIKLQNHDAVVKGDKSGVQIGCKFASKETVRKVREYMTGRKNYQPSLVIEGLGHKKLNQIVCELLLDVGIIPQGTALDFAVEFRIENGEFASTNTGERGRYKKGLYAEVAAGHIFVNAATEMGKLIDLLEGTREKTMKVSLRDEDGTTTNREATITDKGVTIMGETITKEQVEEIWKALQ